MRIFHVTHLKNKHPYLDSIVKWLRHYGHEVEGFDFIDLSRYTGSNEPVEVQMNRDLVEKCLAYKPDMLFVFKGHTIFRESLETIKKKIRPLMAVLWVDDPFAHWDDAFNIFPFKNSLQSLLLWDYFFVYDSYFIDRLEKLGVKNPYYLPNATDDQYFFKMETIEPGDREFYGADISFVGRPSRNRARMIKTFEGYNIRLWGGLGQWFDPYYKNLIKKEFVQVDEIRKVFNLTALNLNIHFPITVRGTNVRTFDIPACGGFLLTDHCKDITEKLFTADQEVVTYKDFKEMKQKADYYLAHEKERKEIAENARKKVLKKHLYKHRVAEFLDVIKAG